MYVNAYYLINASLIEQARQCAPQTGFPNQLFQCVISPNGTKATVQAEWNDEAVVWLSENATFLGELQPDGSASQGVYEELEKPGWQWPVE